MKKKIAVIGSGSWATAIVKILLENSNPVYWWIREEEIYQGVIKNGRNPLYLSDVQFDIKKLHISTDLTEIIQQADDLVFVTPSAFLHKTVHHLPKNIFKGKRICSAIKGIIPETYQVVGDYFHSKFHVDYQSFCVISGPSHAEEIALSRLTYLTAASGNAAFANDMAERFRCSYVKTCTSDDIYGTEYCPILKNIYAIGVGICKGLGYGDNFIAVFISNAVLEMEQFIEKVHPIDRKLYHSVYLGDLLVTAYSQHSRNRTFGTMIGSGYSIKSAQLEMKMIAEGYYATKGIYEISSKSAINMPIVNAVYNILYSKSIPRKEIEILSETFK